jgi:hypothetical protein
MSSGFVSAVAFRGRKNTLLMGQESVSGFTTSNGYFEYPPNLIMNLSTNYIADRNKTIYPEKLIPDLITDTSNDEKLLQKAIDWLNNQP